MFNVKKMTLSSFCLALIPMMTGCGGTTNEPVVLGTLKSPVDLPSFVSMWEETVTKDATTTKGSSYYFDANNQLIAMKLPTPSNLAASTQVIAENLVKGIEVTRFKVVSSTEGTDYTAFLNMILVSGSLQRTGNAVTFTFTYITINIEDDSQLTTTSTLTGTTTDGQTIKFTKLVTQTTPTDSAPTTYTTNTTWTLKTGNPLQ